MSLKANRQRVADLTSEIAATKKERGSIGNAAVTEKRVMTDAEREKFTAAGAKIDDLDVQLSEAQALLKASEEANEAERAQASRGTVADPDVDAARIAASSIQVGADALDKRAKAPGFFGDQLLAIRKHALLAKGMDVPMTADERGLVKMMAAATGANTDVPSDGGFLVAPERSNSILQRVYETGQVLSRVRRMPIGANSNGMKFPAIDETSRADSSRFGGIVSTWVGQGNSVTSGKPKFRELDLKLRKLMATVYATDEQIVDGVAFEGWVNEYLPQELQFRAEDSVFNGSGSNQPLGVLNGPALISITRASSNHVIYDDVSGMWKRMWSKSRLNSVWFVDQSVEQELEQINIPIGTAGVLAPVYRPAGSLPGQVYATLYGRPIIPVEYCANLGTVGDILLADLSEYIVIDKGGVNQAVSIHVAFLTDEQVFRFIYRVDGQPAWNSALTPKSGGSTLSCTVALAT